MTMASEGLAAVRATGSALAAFLGGLTIKYRERAQRTKICFAQGLTGAEGTPLTIIAGSPDRRIAGSPDRRIAGSPDRRIAGSPDRRIAGSPFLRLRGGIA